MFYRRQFLKSCLSLVAASSFASKPMADATKGRHVILRAIPGSGEELPVVGMGTSRTFDAPADPSTLESLTSVMQVFFDYGGKVIDSSPMYGYAETRVGEVLAGIDPRPPVFAATKVWVNGQDNGVEQMNESSRRMGINPLDLIAVHNLRDWPVHLETLKKWKKQKKVRYIGITTSHGRDHAELIDIMKSEPLDFVQFSYNILNRTAEAKLLPTALEKGIATMINRPFQRGSLFKISRGQPLPDIAHALDCNSWGQFYLKFIIGHPAVTCVIPATSKVHHMKDNMQANLGSIPDAKQRDEMLRVFSSLQI